MEKVWKRQKTEEETTERDMEMEGTTLVTCRGCAMFVFLPEEDRNYTCCKCRLIALLEEKVKGLEANLSTLQLIREGEEFLDRAQEATEEGQRYQTNPQKTEQNQAEQREEWNNVTHRTKRVKKISPSLELRNRFKSLPTEDITGPLDEEQLPQATVNEEKDSVVSNKQRKPVSSQMRRKRRVVVIGDSLLRGTEAAICRPDQQVREVCCLPGAKVRDVAERLPRLFKPTDSYPLLLIHVGTNNTARRSLEDTVRDYEVLGKRVRELGAQVVFSSLLPVEGRGPGRERRILEMNNWLRRWCQRERFGFLDHGMRFRDEGLLASDGLHLTRTGKNVFGRRLANLIRRALN